MSLYYILCLASVTKSRGNSYKQKERHEVILLATVLCGSFRLKDSTVGVKIIPSLEDCSKVGFMTSFY